MKKIIIAIIVAALFIINIVAAAFIFLDIEAMKFPDTTIRIDLIEINSEEAIIHYDVDIKNPNSFELMVKNLNVVATTNKGDEIAQLTMDGGVISPQKNRTFASTGRIAFAGNVSGILTSTITGTIGVKFFGFIQKTLPVAITVLTSVTNIVKQIALPTVTLKAEFGTITRKDIELSADINVHNPNPFDITLQNVSLRMETDTGKNVGNFSIAGAKISGKNTVVLTGHGIILLDAFNAKTLVLTLSAEAGATIAGINKSLPFYSTIQLAVPSLQEYIPRDKPLELAIGIDFRLARGGLLGDVTLELINPTKIPLLARDIVVDYYRVDNGNKTFLARTALGEGELAPENTTFFTGKILLPFSLLINPLKGGILPDSLFARLETNLSISGINQTLMVGLGSYTDLHPFLPTR